ncbi:MAG TPA: VOC family protein [Candidatus Dormibacteraeota bacterium]|nr:VOC family protein [Candidatus Dormibacteraeota bacterium]
MRLRQIAFAAHDRDAVVADLCAVLGIEVSFNDPGVAAFGLCNAVMPVGDAFLEVVSPTQADTAGGRYLARRGGDCGYMVMVQVEDTDATRRRAAAQGARVVWSIDLDDISGTHFHPRDLGGALLSVDTPRPPTAWRWAGPDWPAHVRTAVVDGLAAVDMACADPAATSARWAALLGRPAQRSGAAHEIVLDAGRLRFLPGAAPGEDGVVALDLRATDRPAALAAAAARGLAHGADWVRLCGTRLRFV